MSSASPGAKHRKPTQRALRKAPTLRPDSNTSGTAGGREVNVFSPQTGQYHTIRATFLRASGQSQPPVPWNTNVGLPTAHMGPGGLILIYSGERWDKCHYNSGVNGSVSVRMKIIHWTKEGVWLRNVSPSLVLCDHLLVVGYLNYDIGQARDDHL